MTRILLRGSRRIHGVGTEIRLLSGQSHTFRNRLDVFLLVRIYGDSVISNLSTNMLVFNTLMLLRFFCILVRRNEWGVAFFILLNHLIQPAIASLQSFWFVYVISTQVLENSTAHNSVGESLPFLVYIISLFHTVD